MAKRNKKRKAVAKQRRSLQRQEGQRAPIPGTTPAPESVNSVSASQAAAQDRFVRDLLVRGEAQELTSEGKLPLAATHKIVKRKPRGTTEVRRARFKTF